jgi:hypothetical protein
MKKLGVPVPNDGFQLFTSLQRLLRTEFGQMQEVIWDELGDVTL